MENENLFSSVLHVNNESKQYLLETAKWAKFLGIIGFIAVAFTILVLIIFIYANVMDIYKTFGYGNSISIYFLLLFYFLFAVFLFFVSRSSFLFGAKTQKVILFDNHVDFQISLKHLRSIFRLYGILIILNILFVIFIIFLSLYFNSN